MNDIIKQFAIEEKVLDYLPYGEGHIHQTYLINTTNPHKQYILHRINHYVFKDVAGLMNNYQNVITHLKSIQDSPLQVVELLPTKTGSYYVFSNSGYYRLISYIGDSQTFQSAPSPEHMFLAGQAFGQFIHDLSAIDMNSIIDIIPAFHDTLSRLNQLIEAYQHASQSRKDETAQLLEDILSMSTSATIIVSALEEGHIPYRLTHNDTKLNNLLFAKDGRSVRAVVDLDTIMKGSLLYDFGDAIRSGCNRAIEDEKDLDKIVFDFDYFKSYTEGFLLSLKDMITENEVGLLVDGALTMTYELVLRFLTDYLNGDTYFKTDYKTHNLIRAISQFTLFKRFKQREVDMRETVQSIWTALKQKKKFTIH